MQCRPAPSPSTDSTSLPRPPYTSLTRSVSGRSGLRCSHWAGLAGLAGLAMLARPLLLLLLLLPPAGRPRPSAAGGLSRPEAKRRRAGGRALRGLQDEPARPCRKKAPPSPPHLRQEGAAGPSRPHRSPLWPLLFSPPLPFPPPPPADGWTGERKPRLSAVRAQACARPAPPHRALPPERRRERR